MSVSFVIESWAACAPGLDTPQDWSRWAAAPWLPKGEPQVALSAVPPMQRRRFAPLGRMVAQATLDLGGDVALAGVPVDPSPSACVADEPDNPTVFASRYGETSRCLELLADQARGDALSPTAFGLSVHNAIGAMVAIVRGDRRNSSAIAAGRATAAAGVVEAVGLLADGARSASLIVYDAPLPIAYAHFQDEPSAHFAWAWRLRQPRPGEQALRLDWTAQAADDLAAAAAAPASHLPASLQVLWFGLSDAGFLHQRADGRCCRWSRDA